MGTSKVGKHEEEFEGELDELIAGISKIKNHSSIFWEELEKICPNSKLKRRELRNNYVIG